MINIKINKRYYEMPTCWDELSGSQLIQVLEAFDTEYVDQKRMLHLLKILTKISRVQFALAAADELREYFYLLRFLFGQNDLSKNSLPKINGYYGAADYLDNLVVKEFIYAESHYLQFKDAGSV